MNSISTSEPRVYRKKARAQQEEETRQRIVDAALDHGLAGHELHAVSGRQDEGLHFVLGGEDGRLGTRGVERRRPLPSERAWGG